MIPLAMNTTAKNPIRQISTVRPVNGRGVLLSSAATMSSSCGNAEVIARGCPLAAHDVIEMERERRRSGQKVRILGDEDAPLARLVRPNVDDEAAVVARLHHVEQRAGE